MTTWMIFGAGALLAAATTLEKGQSVGVGSIVSGLLFLVAVRGLDWIMGK